MKRSFWERWWYSLVKNIMRLAAVVIYHVRFSGQHNIPLEGSVLAVSNHQSHLDPPLVGIGCPRQMSYLARESLFRFAPVGWFFRSVGAFPIDREGVGLSGIKESLKRLKHGDMLLVFPEGTRTSDGEIAKFRPGFTTLATRSKAVILPLAIDGAFEAYPRSKKFPGFGRLRVHYGKPILPSEYADYDDKELVAEVERRVRECQAILKSHRSSGK